MICGYFESLKCRQINTRNCKLADLKVDVHRKNSSDSSEGAFFRNDKVLVVDEVNSQESSKEKSNIYFRLEA